MTDTTSAEDALNKAILTYQDLSYAVCVCSAEDKDWLQKTLNLQRAVINRLRVQVSREREKTGREAMS